MQPAGEEDPTTTAIVTTRQDIYFKDVEDLHKALEEYATFHDGTITRAYGPPSPAEPGPRTGDEAEASHERIMRQNTAIDRAMCRLAVMAPLSHRLLHAYYRRPGPSGTPAACQEAKGWELAARRSRLAPTKADRLSRPTFDALLEEAVGLLFVAHRAKHVFRP